MTLNSRTNVSVTNLAIRRGRSPKKNKRKRALRKVFRGMLAVALLAVVVIGGLRALNNANRRSGWLLGGLDGLSKPATVPATGAGSSRASDATRTSTAAGGAKAEPTTNIQAATSVGSNKETPFENTEPQESSPSNPVKDVNNLTLINRTHPLSASYVPKLVAVQAPISPDATSEERLMQPEAAKALERMIQKAAQDKIALYCVSGYRSFATQEALYEFRVQTDGQAEADRYTAHPGQSEHQTGLAMDVTSQSGVQGNLEGDFGQTAEGQWLAANAQNFGFILRYPKGKETITGYNYEPWHIRYVGVTDAKSMTSRGLVLEEYTR